MIGQVLGHYRVVAKIGEGGMGVVYRAQDEVLHRDVALKVVQKGAGLAPSASQNLLHEARASSSLAHPNICTIYEVGETDGELYIVMELVEGKSLCAMSGEAGLPAESVLRYGVQISSALVRAHDRGIVHGDLEGGHRPRLQEKSKRQERQARQENKGSNIVKWLRPAWPTRFQIPVPGREQPADRVEAGVAAPSYNTILDSLGDLCVLGVSILPKSMRSLDPTL